MNVLGKSTAVKKMDKFSVFERLPDFQNMLTSFPGLIDMLPNPALFPDAEEFYSQEGWPGDIKPSQEKLNHSKQLKEKIWRSPLFSKSTHLISQGHETTSSMPWNDERSDRDRLTSSQGDGAVLSTSSLAPDLPTYLVTGEHGNLLNEESVISSVIKIANGETLELPQVSADGNVDNSSQMGLIPEPVSVTHQPPNTEKAIEALTKHYISESKFEALFLPKEEGFNRQTLHQDCLLYTSPSPRDRG